MNDPIIQDLPETEGTHAATKAAVFTAAERLFALHGFQNLACGPPPAPAGVTRPGETYLFPPRAPLLSDFSGRPPWNLTRGPPRWRPGARGPPGAPPPVREILAAYFAPPLRWGSPDNERRISVQFIIRARSEGTEDMREVLRNDVSHLARFADALMAARPDLPKEDVYWRLHFVLGLVHNNRFAEFDRLHHLSGGITREADVEALLRRMLDFAEAGFMT